MEKIVRFISGEGSMGGPIMERFLNSSNTGSQYSYGRQNWFGYSAAEHKAAREGVTLFDQSSFGKFLLQGRDAERVLNRICANDVAVPPGRIVYTQWLNERGGIEADLTVTRLDADAYLIVSAAATQARDLHWLQQHIPEDARALATDVTSSYAVLGIMGPGSRALLSRLTEADLSNSGFPFGTSRDIEMGYARLRASRITYVGELGWELYIPTEFAAGVYEAIASAGDETGLVHAGYRHRGRRYAAAGRAVVCRGLRQGGGLHRARSAASPEG